MAVLLEATDSALAFPPVGQPIYYSWSVHAVAECGSIAVPARPGHQIRVIMHLECITLTSLPQSLAVPVPIGVPMGNFGPGASGDDDETIGNSFPRAP